MSRNKRIVVRQLQHRAKSKEWGSSVVGRWHRSAETICSIILDTRPSNELRMWKKGVWRGSKMQPEPSSQWVRFVGGLRGGGRNPPAVDMVNGSKIIFA